MIKIICIGKLKERYLIDMVNDYLSRINKYHSLELIELKDSNKNQESIEIINHIKENDYVIGLDMHGSMVETIEFKNIIEKLFINGTSNIVFLIGGSDGLDSNVLKKCNKILSFSLLTFPHGLFRAILLEQIYRIFKIMNNESYHK